MLWGRFVSTAEAFHCEVRHKNKRENFVKKTAKWLPEVFVLALAAAMRLPGLGGPPLTVSETRIWMFARDSWAHAFKLFGLEADYHTGTAIPYVWLTKLWMSFAGDSEAALRALSTAAGLVTVVVFYFLAKRLFGRHAAVAAAALFSVYPYHIAASRTVGPDAIGLLFCVLALLLFHRIYEGSRGKATVAGFAAVMLIGVNFSFHTVLLLIPLNILFFGFAKDMKKSLWWWIPLNLLLIGSVVLWEPRWAATFFSRPSLWVAAEDRPIYSFLPNEDIVGLKSKVIFISKYYVFVFTLGGFYFCREWLVNGWSALGWLTVAVACHYFPYLGFREYEDGYRSRVFAFIMLASVIGAAVILSFTVVPVWTVLLPAAPLLAAVMANGVIRFSRWRGKTLMALLFLCTALGFVPMQRQEENARPDWRSAATHLSAAPGGETIVLTDGGASTLPIFYYMRGQEKRIVNFMPDIDLETIGRGAKTEDKYRQAEVLPVIHGTVDARPPDGFAHLFFANDRLWVIQRGSGLPEEPRWAREYAIWAGKFTNNLKVTRIKDWRPTVQSKKANHGKAEALKKSEKERDTMYLFLLEKKETRPQ